MSKQLTAYYTGMKIFVDGIEIEPKDGNGKAVEPFSVDGTTYLPLRAIAVAFGKSVEWDSMTNTAYIGKRPGSIQYLVDVCPAYQKSNLTAREMVL